LRAEGTGLRVQGAGCRVQSEGTGCKVQGARCTDYRFWVTGAVFRVYALGFRA
jgi:hypothetical protein